MYCTPYQPVFVVFLLEYGADPNTFMTLDSGYKLYVMEAALFIITRCDPLQICVKSLAEKKSYFNAWNKFKKHIEKYPQFKSKFNDSLKILKDNGYDISQINN